MIVRDWEIGVGVRYGVVVGKGVRAAFIRFFKSLSRLNINPSMCGLIVPKSKVLSGGGSDSFFFFLGFMYPITELRNSDLGVFKSSQLIPRFLK